MSDNAAVLEAEIRGLIAADQFEIAENRLRVILASGSGPLAFWRMWVHVLRHLGRVQEALPLQRMVVDAVPGDLTARFDLAEMLLLLGEFEQGWQAYRFRYGMPHTTAIERKVQGPRWAGENLAGRTLLIHDEQGFGDTFQFMRLLPQVKKLSQARVIFDVNAQSLSLAKRSLQGEIDDVIPSDALPPPFDVHCELMSLPMALKLKLSDLPGKTPYLRPDKTRVTKWRARLAKLPRPLVALAWAGRPTHNNDANRSMTLATLAPLAASGAHFLAIQKGPAAEQAKNPPPGMSITSLDDEIKDFEDTAAILMIADLLICVDSSPGHLAGALGRPAWIMLPFAPDWRWLQNRSDSPWYPNHRLFRQPQRHQWDAVVRDMAESLQGLRR